MTVGRSSGRGEGVGKKKWLPVTYINTISFGFLVHLSNKRTLDHYPIHVFWLLLGHKSHVMFINTSSKTFQSNMYFVPLVAVFRRTEELELYVSIMFNSDHQQ